MSNLETLYEMPLYLCSQEEFRRLYVQLEVLKEKNMRLGNRHLVTKIHAMQEAASRAETQVSTIQAISSSLRLSSEPSTLAVEDVFLKKEEKTVDVYHVEIYQDSTSNTSKSLECTKDDKSKHDDSEADAKEQDDDEPLTSSTKERGANVDRCQEIAAALDLSKDSRDSALAPAPGAASSSNTKDRAKSKSGHARTHAIVINLDDKSRFSEEVTV